MADLGQILQSLGIVASSVGGGLLDQREREEEEKRRQREEELHRLFLQDRQRRIEREGLEDVRSAADLASSLLAESGTPVPVTATPEIPMQPTSPKGVASTSIPLPVSATGEVAVQGQDTIESIAAQFGVDPKTLQQRVKPLAELKESAKERAFEISVQQEIERAKAVHEETADIRQALQEEDMQQWLRKERVSHENRMKEQAAGRSESGMTFLQLRNVLKQTAQGSANSLALRLRDKGKGSQVTVSSPTAWYTFIKGQVKALYPEALDGDIDQAVSFAVQNYHPDFEGRRPLTESSFEEKIRELEERSKTFSSQGTE